MMPIHVAADLQVLTEELFKEIAYVVTGIAFSVHKEFGGLFSEKVYQHEVVSRCKQEAAWPVQVEGPVRVTHRDFEKAYYVDLLVAGGALFEVKAAEAIHREHRAQTLNYLFLTGLNRAKVINFGPDHVGHEFVSTRLTPEDRREFTLDRDRWSAADDASRRFEAILVELLRDWGCFLHLSLYNDAITHFFGGEGEVLRDTPVVRDGIQIGTQKVRQISPDTAFRLTALGGHLGHVEDHLRRFLRHTPLRVLHWINLHQQEIRFHTLANDC